MFSLRGIHAQEMKKILNVCRVFYCKYPAINVKELSRTVFYLQNINREEQAIAFVEPFNPFRFDGLSHTY